MSGLSNRREGELTMNTIDDVAHPESLQALDSFQAFLADLDDRSAAPPVTTGATIVGGYR
jgi:hypothetical protein